MCAAEVTELVSTEKISITLPGQFCTQKSLIQLIGSSDSGNDEEGKGTLGAKKQDSVILFQIFQGLIK